jgi:hypothetical protein
MAEIQAIWSLPAQEISIQGYSVHQASAAAPPGSLGLLGFEGCVECCQEWDDDLAPRRHRRDAIRLDVVDPSRKSLVEESHMRIGRLALIVLILLTLTSIYLTGVWADPPSCSPFGDAGCFFGENWENGIAPCTAWACSSFLSNRNLVSVSPGLNGTNRAVRILYGNDTSGSSGSGGWADVGLGRSSANGDVFYVEWWTKFSPGFFFGPGGPNGDFPSFKHFEWQGGTNTPGCENRILLTLVGDSGSNYATAYPEWYVAPNFGEVAACTTANRTSPGSQNLGGFVLPSGIGSNFKVQSNVLYHVVVEFKSHNNQQGYIKTWFNDVLVLQATGMTTCANVGAGCNWSLIRFGGQFGKTVAGSYADWDHIRATTTNLSPNASNVIATPGPAAPAAPTGVRVQ